MPRETIDLPYTVDYLSILDKDGNVDTELEPALDGEFLKKLHRSMLLSRRFDEKLLSLHGQGRMGTFAPIKGQEASQLGAAAVLAQQDWVFPSFREMAAEIWRGKPMESILLVYAGYNEGGAIPEEQRVLPVCIPVGVHLPYAAGMMYAAKYRQADEVGMAFFGDGATSEGDFHEAMNFAGVFRIPLVFVCQNNQWAISIPREKQTRSKTLAQKALAYGMPGIQVDGNDILAVYVATKEAADRARAGDGPTMIECLTYRMAVHTTADDPKKYRTKEEEEEWVDKDPLDRFRKYLASKDLLSDDEIESLEDEIKSEIKSAIDTWDKKRKKAGDPVDMFEHVFEELPPYLADQKEAFRKEVKE